MTVGRAVRALFLPWVATPVIAACAGTSGAPGECGPEGWQMAEMLEPIGQRFDIEKFDEAGLLEWRVTEDVRPLYVESALVAARKGDRWLLASIYRHPRDGRGRGWRISVVPDAADHTSVLQYDAPPSAVQTEEFRSDSWWPQGDGGSFGVIDQGTCGRWWAARSTR